MYKATTKTQVSVISETIQKDGYSSIQFVNLGTDDALINDNIPLTPGSSFSFENLPGTIIDEHSNIRFLNEIDTIQKVLVIMTYFK